jgi:hypothetical protein
VTTAEILMERAFALIADETEPNEAVEELLTSSGNRRVAVVMARRHLLEQVGDDSDPRTARAVALLDQVLLRLPEE